MSLILAPSLRLLKDPLLCAILPGPGYWRKDKQEAQRAILRVPLKDDDLVFCDLEDKPLLPDTVTHAWIKLVRHSGLRGIRLHDAGHTHAPLMLKQGAHPKIVRERPGHTSIQITLGTYSHVAPGLQQAAAAGFDTMVFYPNVKERPLKIISSKF